MNRLTGLFKITPGFNRNIFNDKKASSTLAGTLFSLKAFTLFPGILNSLSEKKLSPLSFSQKNIPNIAKRAVSILSIQPAPLDTISLKFDVEEESRGESDAYDSLLKSSFRSIEEYENGKEAKNARNLLLGKIKKTVLRKNLIEEALEQAPLQELFNLLGLLGVRDISDTSWKKKILYKVVERLFYEEIVLSDKDPIQNLPFLYSLLDSFEALEGLDNVKEAKKALYAFTSKIYLRLYQPCPASFSQICFSIGKIEDPDLRKQFAYSLMESKYTSYDLSFFLPLFHPFKEQDFLEHLAQIGMEKELFHQKPFYEEFFSHVQNRQTCKKIADWFLQKDPRNFLYFINGVLKNRRASELVGILIDKMKDSPYKPQTLSLIEKNLSSLHKENLSDHVEEILSKNQGLREELLAHAERKYGDIEIFLEKIHFLGIKDLQEKTALKNIIERVVKKSPLDALSKTLNELGINKIDDPSWKKGILSTLIQRILHDTIVLSNKDPTNNIPLLESLLDSFAALEGLDNVKKAKKALYAFTLKIYLSASQPCPASFSQICFCIGKIEDLPLRKEAAYFILKSEWNLYDLSSLVYELCPFPDQDFLTNIAKIGMELDLGNQDPLYEPFFSHIKDIELCKKVCLWFVHSPHSTEFSKRYRITYLADWILLQNPNKRDLIPFFVSLIQNHPEKGELAETIFKLSQENKEFELFKENVLSEIWPTEVRKEIMHKILSYRNPEIATFLLKQLLEKDHSAEYKTAFFALSYSSQAKRVLVHAILPTIILAKWVAESGTSPPDEALLFLGYRKQLRNKTGFLLPQCLLTLKALDETTLSPAQKIEFFAKACDLKLSEDSKTVKEEKEPLTVIKNFRLLSYFSKAGEEKELLTIDVGLNLNKELNSLFQKKLINTYAISSLSEEEVFERYEKTFGSLRVPYALETYTGAISQIPEMQLPLKQFVQAVLLGTFEKERYLTEGNLHLQRMEKLDPEMVPHIPFEKQVEENTNKKMTDFNYKNFFLEKLKDGHWNEGGVDKLPLLTHFLKTGEKKEGRGEDPSLCLVENLCIFLIQNNGSKGEELANIELALQSHSLELLNDIRVLLKKKNNPIETKGEKIVISQEMEDLFLAGTESGSCQRVDGSGGYNKCLLGYLDPKVSIVAFKDSTGKIIARSILRKLEDPESGKFVFFLSRHYGKSALQEQMIKAVSEYATLRRSKLYLPGGDHPLRSYGNRYPYEYVDEAGGVTNGVYEVFGKQFL